MKHWTIYRAQEVLQHKSPKYTTFWEQYKCLSGRFFLHITRYMREQNYQRALEQMEE